MTDEILRFTLPAVCGLLMVIVWMLDKGEDNADSTRNRI